MNKTNVSILNCYREVITHTRQIKFFIFISVDVYDFIAIIAMPLR